MDTKKCPICGSKINAEATKCKYCKEWITPEVERVEQPKRVEMVEEANKVEAPEAVAQPTISQPIKRSMLAVLCSIGLLTLSGINFFYSCIMLSERTSTVDGAMPEWLIATLQLIMLFGILMTMHRHFVAARSKLSQFIFALLLTPFLIAIVGIFADTITDSSMARMLALPGVFGIIAGLAVANSENEKAPALGLSLFIVAVVECVIAIFVGENEIYWWSEILSFLSLLIFSLVACNYFLHAPKYDVAEPIEQKQNPWFVGIAVILMAILTLLMLASSADDEEYAQDTYDYRRSNYRLEQDDMFYCSDDYYFSLATDSYGFSHIIKSDSFDALGAKSIATPEELECEKIYKLHQSSEYSYIVYYNGIDSEHEYISGVLDLRSGSYILYTLPDSVEVLGVISRGKYAGNFVLLYGFSEIQIYKQVQLGTTPTLITTGDISECLTYSEYERYYSGELSNYDERVINYLHTL